MMDKTKFYKITTIALLVLNISVFAFFFMSIPSHKDDPRKMHDFKNRAVKALDLDEKQTEEFTASVERHKKMMHRINRNQSKLMEQYFSGLTDDNSTPNNDEILAEYSMLEQEKIEHTYLHFEEIKQILNSGQSDKYEKFIERAMEVLINKNHRKPPPRR